MKMNKLFFCFVAASMILSTGKATASTIDYTLTSVPGRLVHSPFHLPYPRSRDLIWPCTFYHGCFSVSDVSFTLNGTNLLRWYCRFLRFVARS